MISKPRSRRVPPWSAWVARSLVIDPGEPIGAVNVARCDPRIGRSPPVGWQTGGDSHAWYVAKDDGVPRTQGRRRGIRVRLRRALARGGAGRSRVRALRAPGAG